MLPATHPTSKVDITVFLFSLKHIVSLISIKNAMHPTIQNCLYSSCSCLQRYTDQEVFAETKNTIDAPRGNILNVVLTSFLSWGKRKGSLTLSPETIVRTGSKQRNTAPMISIFPSFGSTGSIDRNFPDWILREKNVGEKSTMTSMIGHTLMHSSNKASQTRVKRLTKICQIFLLIQCPNHFQKINGILNLSSHCCRQITTCNSIGAMKLKMNRLL